MITEEDLESGALAGMEPEQRFRFIEQLAAKRLNSERDYEGRQIYDDYDYMSSVLEAARVCSIFDLLEWEMPARSNEDWQLRCRNFRAEATRTSQRILFEHASRPVKDPNTVALDAATKERLRFHLGQVRSIIDKDSMPEWRKQDLFSAIAELEREIDKSRTRLAAVLDVVGKAFGGSEPIMDALLKVVTIIQDNKAAEKEKAKLLAPVEPKLIEAPKPKQLSPPESNKPRTNKKNSFDRALDEEIPF